MGMELDPPCSPQQSSPEPHPLTADPGVESLLDGPPAATLQQERPSPWTDAQRAVWALVVIGAFIVMLALAVTNRSGAESSPPSRCDAGDTVCCIQEHGWDVCCPQSDRREPGLFDSDTGRESEHGDAEAGFADPWERETC
ncbi:MAG: hypothetical protein AAF567_07220 [Actinomycetota bacterium]